MFFVFRALVALLTMTLLSIGGWAAEPSTQAQLPNFWGASLVVLGFATLVVLRRRRA
ncbi:hypothetical protein [Teredinibacter sp. KSP-S5-2]|uniref:hypothetical protein n=1 Tax=Teredinibacter sp. KSP-S5-2 TaxID=3034506 RepID=UPI0029348652|nr:hypothetical protein [Teredinibacter sp. KSP-S5-2]WNO10217.1 hypothetical protein P5V12_03425 [Teredinibacter sp. KSP-S5-2]